MKMIMMMMTITAITTMTERIVMSEEQKEGKKDHEKVTEKKDRFFVLISHLFWLRMDS